MKGTINQAPGNIYRVVETSVPCIMIIGNAGRAHCGLFYPDEVVCDETRMIGTVSVAIQMDCLRPARACAASSFSESMAAADGFRTAT
jgi:hypothetical protein